MNVFQYENSLNDKIRNKKIKRKQQQQKLQMKVS
jgi:hypothetical protein